MIRRSFFWKLYLSYAGLVLVSTVVIGVLVLGHLKKNALHETEASLLNTAQLLAAMEAANPAHLWSEQLIRHVVEVAADTGLKLSLLFANGTPAAESEASVAAAVADGRPVAVLNLPELRGARENRFGRDIRSLAGAEHLLVAVPILVDYETIGYVRAGLPLSHLAGRDAELRRRVLAGASLNAIVALGLGFFFARHVTRPLATIGAGCERLASGHFDERIALQRRDEIGVVATTINEMAAEVQRRIYSETRERQRLATLLAVMADGVVAVSARQTIAYLNDVAARILGLDAATLAGRDATDRLFREHVRQADVVAVYDEARAAGRRIVREVRVTGHPEDQVIGVDATPLTDPSGQPFGVLLVLHDLTEIRRLEETRRVFAANVSHELKTPLTAIGSLVDTLLDHPEMARPLRERFLGKIQRQSERLQRLVQDILLISRLESDRVGIELAPVELEPLVSECVQTFADVARQKNLTLSWTAPPIPVWIRGNPEALRLIANNLLHNAVIYTPVAGTVSVGLARADGWATLTIRDTGVGIAPEHLERIFERFYRVDASRAARDAGGSGLGLSIVKHLAQALDGRVLVESRPGEGSVFTVQLQLAAAPERRLLSAGR